MTTRRLADLEAIAAFVLRELPFGWFGAPDEVDRGVLIATWRASPQSYARYTQAMPPERSE